MNIRWMYSVFVSCFVVAGGLQKLDLDELSLLDDLEMLSAKGQQEKTKRNHLCSFRQPYKRWREKIHFRRVLKTFQVPCKPGTSSDGLFKQVRNCTGYRFVHQPVKRRLMETTFRTIKKCCSGWKGKTCSERWNSNEGNKRRQLSRLKPGRCPQSSTNTTGISCTKHCSQDGDCFANMKCCPSVCGSLQCVPPTLLISKSNRRKKRDFSTKCK